MKCESLKRDQAVKLYQCYDEVIRTFVGMINHADKWILKTKHASIIPSPYRCTFASPSPGHPLTHLVTSARCHGFSRRFVNSDQTVSKAALLSVSRSNETEG